ncbi:MAG: peptide methionine sulfoxide reductase [Bacteroidota bacterium]
MGLLAYIDRIPEGYSEASYKGKKYGLSKEIFNQGKSFKIYAEELGGKDFISLNFYQTSDKELLKPCEMPAEKVIDFLKEVKL